MALITLVSCNTSVTSPLPNCSGKAGEVAVVCPKADWEAEPGIAVRAILADEFPFLPQPETWYRLFNVPSSAFNEIFQVHRNILMLKYDPALEEPRFLVKQDVWAQPQTVIEITARNAAELAKAIMDNGEKMLGIYDQAERMRVISNCKKFEAAAIRSEVAAKFGGSPYFPSEYGIKKNTSDFMWISYETNFTNQGVFIYKFLYTPGQALTAEWILEKHNQVIKDEVPGMVEGSYMTTSQAMIPGYRWVKVSGKEFAEIRGLWEVENDYMGGPFVLHAFLNRDNTEVIVTEAFVYAPKYEKRNYLKQVESIIYSFEWQDEFGK